MTGKFTPNKLKVLLLGPFPPPHGGVEMNLAALRNYMLEHEICCTVVNLTRHRNKASAGVYYPDSALGVIRMLLQAKTEIVHLHIGGNVSWRLLGLGMLCSLLPYRKLILTLHSGGYPSSPAGKAARRGSVRGFLLRRFDGLIGVNQELIDMFIRFGVHKDKVRLILPFALPERVPDVELPETVRDFLGTHSPVMLTVSGLEPEYDLPLQIEALGRSREKHPNAGLLIIGAGSSESEIRERIAAKLYARHILIAGDLLHDVVLRIMSMSDVLLRTTRYDGDSIAVREAQHFGLPVIATDNGMRPSGVTLIPIGDLDGLCWALHAVLDTPKVQKTSPGADVTNLRAVAEFYQELLATPS